MTEILAPSGRSARRWSGLEEFDPTGDPRSPAQRDVDRIIYSRAWARLAGVTQVLTPSRAGALTHDRMTHSLKVAQVGRTLAIEKQPDMAGWNDRGTVVDPMTVYAAALAHDLGHPPFGHVGEKELNLWAETKKLDGYEGNAQSFRILTRLEPRSRDRPGMDLTGATLNAVLKYPWLRLAKDEREAEGPTSMAEEALYILKRDKWGAYTSDADTFTWARKSAPGLPRDRQVIEASIMDLADDFTYALHDLDDFAQVGLVDPQRVARDARISLRCESDDFSQDQQKTYSGTNPITRIGLKLARDYPEIFEASAWRDALANFGSTERWIEDPAAEEYEDVDDDLGALVVDKTSKHWALPPQNEGRIRLREWTSRQLTLFSSSVKVEDKVGWPSLVMDPVEWHFMQALKNITRHYVISRTDLSAIQFAQRRTLSELCDDLLLWCENDKERIPERLTLLTSRAYDFVPPTGIVENFVEPRSKVLTTGLRRGVVDFVAELTDHQALELHAVLRGRGSNSMVEGILNIF